jgi:hypothetical protein
MTLAKRTILKAMALCANQEVGLSQVLVWFQDDSAGKNSIVFGFDFSGTDGYFTCRSYLPTLAIT